MPEFYEINSFYVTVDTFLPSQFVTPLYQFAFCNNSTPTQWHLAPISVPQFKALFVVHTTG